MSIKVKDLIKELQELDPEIYVVMSSDAEGNTYNFLEGINVNCRYRDGGIYLAELTEELKADGYTEEDYSEQGVDCVVFYPIHDSVLLETVLSSGKKVEDK